MPTTLTHLGASEPVADDASRVFVVAAELFSLLSTPMRLRIISAACEVDRSVGELLAVVGGTQSNLSQHLSVLYRSGVLSRRKVGTTVLYRVQSEAVAALCRTVCVQVAMGLSDESSGPIANPFVHPFVQKLAPANN